MFSPYYAWRRRRGEADPLQHCALNVALYGEARGWTMTERGARHVRRTSNELTLGPSALQWDGGVLVIDIDERTAPFGRKVRGTVRVRPGAFTHRSFTLDASGRHRWSPIAPRAEIDVALHSPALHWAGRGYLDCNEGDVPLEQDFASWQWSRAALGGHTAILYDVTPRIGLAAPLTLLCDEAGGISSFDAPAAVVLPHTRWRVPRATRADQAGAQVRQTLEDTPFYSRSLLDTHLCGQRAIAVHESLSLRRFSAPWVRAMLPFRMPRVG